MKKKAPLGTYKIKSVELGYFIDPSDRVIIGFSKKGIAKDIQAIAQILSTRAQKFFNLK